MDELQELQESNELLTKSIVDIISETYRFKKTFKRILSKLNDEDCTKYDSQFAWFTKRVEKAAENAGLRIEDFTDQEYDAGMAVTALNIEDFDPDDILCVDQMIEPVIMKGEIIQKPGTVILRRKD